MQHNYNKTFFEYYEYILDVLNMCITDIMIEVTKLSKKFDDTYVLRDVSTSFEKGKTNLIIGQSGSGKTVFLKCILGLFSPASGEIVYNKTPLSKMTSKERTMLRQDMGMVFQGSALFDSMTVEENIMFPMKMFTNDHIDEHLFRYRSVEIFSLMYTIGR